MKRKKETGKKDEVIFYIDAGCMYCFFSFSSAYLPGDGVVEMGNRGDLDKNNNLVFFLSFFFLFFLVGVFDIGLRGGVLTEVWRYVRFGPGPHKAIKRLI